MVLGRTAAMAQMLLFIPIRLTFKWQSLVPEHCLGNDLVKPRFGPRTRLCLSHKVQVKRIQPTLLGVWPKPCCGLGLGPVCRRPPTLICREESLACLFRAGCRLFPPAERTAKTSPALAWHSELKRHFRREISS